MTDVRPYKMPICEWPTVDAAAWHQACHPQPGPFSPYKLRSPFTYRKYASGWGIYLRYLQAHDQLDPTETPAQRVTLARLAGFWNMLKARGNADYTLVGRFEEVRQALLLMAPEADVSLITRPQDISIYRMLPMRRRRRFVPDARQVLLWATTLFHEALSLSVARRRVQVRDAALIGLLASRAPRLRTLTGLQLGKHLYCRDGAWMLFFDKALMKGERQEFELPNDPRVSAMLERYITMERSELLDGQTHEAVWVSRAGDPLSSDGITNMFRRRVKRQFGIDFGPHRLRSSLVTTAAMVDGTNIIGPALVLGHSPRTALKSYNRATNIEATRRHDALMSAVEDAALKQRGGHKKTPPRIWG